MHGWSNRATWLVALHLNNTPELQGLAHEAVRDGWGDGIDSAERISHELGLDVDARLRAVTSAADVLAGRVELLLGDRDTGGDVAPEVLLRWDLLGYALADVDWRELAEGFLEDLDGLAELPTVGV